MLTRVTPPEQTATFFGIYALSGTATIWLGSSLVNLGTNIFHTLQGGFGTITLLLGIGFVGLLVRARRRRLGRRRPPLAATSFRCAGRRLRRRRLLHHF